MDPISEIQQMVPRLGQTPTIKILEVIDSAKKRYVLPEESSVLERTKMLNPPPQSLNAFLNK
jgi:hypothetical protein